MSLIVVTAKDISTLHNYTARVGEKMLSTVVAITPRKFSLHVYEILGHTVYDPN